MDEISAGESWRLEEMGLISGGDRSIMSLTDTPEKVLAVLKNKHLTKAEPEL
jgi:hypothetical protein